MTGAPSAPLRFRQHVDHLLTCEDVTPSAEHWPTCLACPFRTCDLPGFFGPIVTGERRPFAFVSTFGAPAKVNARIGHLAESKSAALEYAHAAAGAAAVKETADELLRCEIPEGQSLERHQYRTHLRLYSAVDLLIVGIHGQGNPRRQIESAAHWNH